MDRLFPEKKKAPTGIYFKWIVRVILMAALSMEMLTACGVSPENREERAKAALEKKYEMEFEITEVYPQKFGDLFYRVQAYAVEEPGLRFKAAIDTEDDRISDDLIEKRICAAISRTLGENLDRLPGLFFLYTYPGAPQPLTDDLGISIRDYVALNSRNRFTVDLYVFPDTGADVKAVYDSLTDLLKDSEYLSVDVRLYFVKGEQLDEVQDILDLADENSMDYKRFKQSLFRVELPYESGKLQLTEREFTEIVRDVL